MGLRYVALILHHFLCGLTIMVYGLMSLRTWGLWIVWTNTCMMQIEHIAIFTLSVLDL
uniref:Uncharacterized protein n=1 Tax=Rhizophora mucronata TaxID=61149 RepID=A0A2P2PKC2_RHIMU